MTSLVASLKARAVPHNKQIANMAAFDTYFSSQLLHELEDDARNVLAQTRVGEAEVERFLVRDEDVGVHVLEAEEERGADGDAGGVGGGGGAAEGERGAVDAGGEGGVVACGEGGIVACGEGGIVACGEGVGGVGDEGDDRGGAVVEGGDLQGSVAAASGCA